VTRINEGHARKGMAFIFFMTLIVVSGAGIVGIFLKYTDMTVFFNVLCLKADKI
jgi:hypothetical protein